MHSPLRTERLRLEPLSEMHASALLSYHECNAAYLQPWEPLRDERFYTLERHRSDIDATVADTRAGLCLRFVAFETDSTSIVATCNLSNIRRGIVQGAILSYSVDERQAGRGFATEIGAAVVRYAFGQLGLHRLDASFQPQNRASGRVLQKLGFSVEGYARDYLFLNGAWRDAVLVGRTSDDPSHRRR